MNRHLKLITAALLSASALGTYAQTAGLGLNFASTDPNTDTSALLATETAGVIPQANWNNLVGATGSAAAGTLVYDAAGTSTASAASANWSSPNTWRSGGNN